MERVVPEIRLPESHVLSVGALSNQRVEKGSVLPFSWGYFFDEGCPSYDRYSIHLLTSDVKIEGMPALHSTIRIVGTSDYPHEIIIAVEQLSLSGIGSGVRGVFQSGPNNTLRLEEASFYDESVARVAPYALCKKVHFKSYPFSEYKVYVDGSSPRPTPVVVNGATHVEVLPREVEYQFALANLRLPVLIHLDPQGGGETAHDIIFNGEYPFHKYFLDSGIEDFFSIPDFLK